MVGLGWAFGTLALAQNVLTADEAVVVALKNSPAVKASGLVVRQNEQLVRSARTIPNPDITLDSPSGTFYTLGVQQSFRFPTVYNQQSKLQQQQTVLAQKQKIVTENDLNYRIRTVYLNAQYADAYLKQLQSQVRHQNGCDLRIHPLLQKSSKAFAPCIHSFCPVRELPSRAMCRGAI